MAVLRTETRRDLQTRVCVGCGYRGKELQSDLRALKYECPVCGEDLYARPPRSYWEMEALGAECEDGGAAAPGVGCSSGEARGRSRLVWLAESAIALTVVALLMVVLIG